MIAIQEETSSRAQMSARQTKILYGLLGATVFFGAGYFVFKGTWAKEMFGLGLVLADTAMTTLYLLFYLQKRAHAR